MQILPAIDLRGGQCVRLRQGDYAQETVFGDDPLAMAKKWADAGAGRLHLVDLDGARAGKPVNHEIVGTIARTLDVPCQLGGGIRDEQSLSLVLNDLGVDRAIVGTQALKQPEWFEEMVSKFPGRVALGLDARDSKVATEGWLDVSAVSAIDLAGRYAGLDLAAVIYTNIANDGMMQGVDQSTIDDMVRLTELGFPVIASGGVTTLDDVRHLAETAKQHPLLVGAIVGRAIYEGTIDVAEAVQVAGIA
jgi:phosphoribosylformimino-5-aminoimidazole carboxamide ribotide isomerase